MLMSSLCMASIIGSGLLGCAVDVQPEMLTEEEHAARQSQNFRLKRRIRQRYNAEVSGAGDAIVNDVEDVMFVVYGRAASVQEKRRYLQWLLYNDVREEVLAAAAELARDLDSEYSGSPVGITTEMLSQNVATRELSATLFRAGVAVVAWAGMTLYLSFQQEGTSQRISCAYDTASVVEKHPSALALYPPFLACDRPTGTAVLSNTLWEGSEVESTTYCFRGGQLPGCRNRRLMPAEEVGLVCAVMLSATAPYWLQLRNQIRELRQKARAWSLQGFAAMFQSLNSLLQSLPASTDTTEEGPFGEGDEIDLVALNRDLERIKQELRDNPEQCEDENIEEFLRQGVSAIQSGLNYEIIVRANEARDEG